MDYASLINNKLFKLLISVIILIFLFTLVDINILIQSIENLRSIFLLAILLIPLSIFIRALRWMIIVNENEKLVGKKDSFSLTLVGVSLNLFLPAGMGDIAKSYYGFKWHGSKEAMLSASLADKTIALFSIFLLGSFAALFIKNYYLAIFSFIIALFTLIIIFKNEKIPWKLVHKYSLKILGIHLDSEKLRNTFSISHQNKVFTIFLSIIASMITFFQLYITCLSFNLDVSILYIFAIAPLLNIAILFPLTLNGLGSGETAMVYLLGLAGVSPTLSIVVSLFSQILYSFIPGFFGLLIIIKKDLNKS